MPDDDRALPLLRSPTYPQKGTVNLTTQEAAFSLLATRDYLKVRERVTPDIKVKLTLLTKKSTISHGRMF